MLDSVATENAEATICGTTPLAYDGFDLHSPDADENGQSTAATAA
ncbi:hypothetical protein [Catenulispora pinistramenti]|nr:hypothetical protein [Catenulispora pinistramenti]